MTMKKEDHKNAANIGRRDFMKIGAGAAGATMTMGAMLTGRSADAAAQTQEKGEPFWAARPGAAGVGKPISIDCHSHWAPASYTKALADIGRPTANPFPLDYDLDKRVKWMDDHGVQMNCLTLNGSMPWQSTSPTVGAQLAAVINDAGIKAHLAYPDRFVLGVEMPIRDSQLALKELNRVAGKPGVRAVHLPDSMERHDYLFDPGFAPVLARIEELGYPIIFHQMGGVANTYSTTRNLPPPDYDSALDAPFEHTVIAMKFMVTGTLDKYPKLEIVLPHAGGTFPYLAGRIEHFMYHMRNPGEVKLDRPFREYIRRFHYDYLIYYPEAFRFLVDLVGPDRIVVGTDNFAAKDIEYPTAVLDQFNLPAVDRDRILEGNAKRLLHL
jgi:aminocarboxymuconate-semialdehyde decarboxylase